MKIDFHSYIMRKRYSCLKRNDFFFKLEKLFEYFPFNIYYIKRKRC